MEVEFEGDDSSKFTLGEGDTAVFGRGFGFNTTDRTVSHRHVSFQLNNSDSDSDSDSGPRVSFEVTGRNPIWVWTRKDPTVRVFRKSEKGELEFGDRFCLSGKEPVWFHLKGSELQEGKRDSGSVNEAVESSPTEDNFEDLDISGIDPVKEFGFLVMGHEFDHYPKGMIRNVKDWVWFLEEPSKDSEDGEDFGNQRREMRRKRKKGKDNEDDEWTGDGEDDKDLVAKIGKGKKPRYSTRSKDSKGSNKVTKGSRNFKQKIASSVNETVENEEEDDDDDDETLGGFIVDDDDDETLGGFIVDDEEDQDEQNNDEEEEEEEEEFEDVDDYDGVED